jgi:general secretion pathway protein J
MNGRGNNRRGEAGFTLIEIVVAMTLMVGVLAALASVTAQWLPNWNRGFAHVQRAELLARGLERLVADLSAAELVSANGKTRQPLFDGGELSVRFVRPAIGPNTRPGLEFVSIAMTAGKAGAALVRTRAPFTLLPRNAGIADVTNFSDPVVLMRQSYRVVFAYAGADHIWRNTWRNADELPAAVRVTVLDAATETRLAVSTAAIVHVSAPAECVSAKSVRDCIYPPKGMKGDAL